MSEPRAAARRGPASRIRLAGLLLLLVLGACRERAPLEPVPPPGDTPAFAVEARAHYRRADGAVGVLTLATHRPAPGVQRMRVSEEGGRILLDLTVDEPDGWVTDHRVERRTRISPRRVETWRQRSRRFLERTGTRPGVLGAADDSFVHGLVCTALGALVAAKCTAATAGSGGVPCAVLGAAATRLCLQLDHIEAVDPDNPGFGVGEGEWRQHPN